MATKSSKRSLEFQLAKAVLTGIPEKRLLKSRNLLQVDLIWPRTGVAKKSGARQVVFKKGVSEFADEPWAKRTIFREDVEARCGIAVSITEPVSIQKIRHFLRLTAKYALKMGSSFMEKALVGYADIASAPIDALVAIVGEKEVPKVIAQGVIDFDALPDEGGETTVEIPLERPLTGKNIGTLTLLVRAQ